MVQTFVHETNYLVDVYIGGEKITTTENHPFWVKDVGWVAARDLGAGSQLETKTESWLGVERVEKHTEVATVYNFEVQGFHTYFVSALGLLVHNVSYNPNSLNRINPNGLDLDLLSQSGQAPYNSALTVAGRNLTKHASGQRLGANQGSGAFGSLKGNSNQINEIAQNHLDDILTHPNSIFERLPKGDIQVVTPDLRGATFSPNGTLLRFVD